MSLLDDVKRRIDIVQIVSDYVDLDTSSRTPKARCPFHSERTPSFVVYPESGGWHCFGSCATGGDAISFVMKAENLPFAEALRKLADRVGVSVTESSGARPSRPASTLYEANEAAARFFTALLKGPDGSRAREYLTSRGITMEVAERRGMGLSPDGLVTVAGHLQSKGIDGKAARDAGLVTKGQDGVWRDMFRGRVTIEIRDGQGRLAGFGARSLDGSEPKYLNTPKSDVFDKSSLLYGLNWARDSIREAGQAVVVEGYMDAIAAHEHGFTNVVASMGTAITAEQLTTLSRLTGGRDKGSPGTVILCLDSDAAGEEATIRGLEAAWRELGAGLTGGSRHGGVQVRVARPSGGKDPDEAIRSDPEAWRQSLAAAVPLLDYLIDAYAGRYDLATGDGKARMAEAVAPLIFATANAYEQDRYWTRLAEILQVDPVRLEAMVPKPSARHRDGGSRGRVSAVRPKDGAAFGDGRVAPEQVAAALEASAGTSLEEHLLSLILRHEDLREFAAAVPVEHFHDSGNRELFTRWQAAATLAEFADAPDDHLAEKVEVLLGRQLPPADQSQRVEEVTQCVRRLRERHLRHLKTLEERAFAELEQQFTGEEREALNRRALDSNARLRQVFTGRS